MSRALSLVVLLVAVSVVGWGISVDPGIVYKLSNGTVQTGIDTVGLPFYVNQTIYVDALGAYDIDFNGIQGATQITVSINPWTPGSFTLGSPIATAILDQNSPSVSGTGAVWSSLGPNGKSINPGWYMVVATGFDSSNRTISITNTDLQLNTFGGRVTYGAMPYSSLGINLYGTAVGSGGTLNQWILTSDIYSVAGGTFSVPEPATYALMGTVGLALYLLRRRKAQAKS